MQIRPYEAADEEAVVDLWVRCGLVRPDLFLVGTLDGQLVATVMAGYEGHRGWINYLAVDPARRRQGLGRTILGEAERRLRATGCPKINLQVRTTNSEVLAFYRQVGYVPDDVVSLGKRLEQDSPTR